MEDLRNSRRPVKPAYGDVFSGGAHKYSSTAKSDDYAEIFGGVAASCSIPFLDLPTPSAERYDSNGDGPIDYSEIFGGFNGGNFAVDYEDLFKKTAETSAASNGRQVDAKFGQHGEGSDFSSFDARKDYGACSEKNNFSSSSNHSDDGSKQFNMSFHGTARGSIEDVTSGKTHITQLHAVPGYTYMVNSCFSQDVESDNSPNILTNDVIDVSLNGRPNDLGQEKRALPTSSTDYTNRDGANLRTLQKECSTKYAASEDDPVNGKYHSRSSSNYSASSGDIPYPDVTYVSISEINLRTQPSRVPPPSRAPPKLASKQEHTKSHQIHYRVGASKSHGVQGVAKDVEVDASSAAAASAAAMKEAMEQAQARLKSAKELMERKRDNLQSRKNLGHKEGSKYDERKDVIASVEETLPNEVTANKSLPKGGRGVKEYTLDDMQKVIKVGKVALDHEERERYVATAEQSRQMRQGNGFKSSQMSYKTEEVSGEWKTEEQFYELINNEKKFRAVKEASKQEDVEKNTKTSRKVSEDKENGPEKDEIANEFRRTVWLHNVNETIERNEIDDRSKACNMSDKGEIRTTPENVPGTCILKENGPEDIPSSLDRNGNKKVQASQGMLASGEELKKPNAGEEALCGGNEMNMASSDNALKFEEIFHDNEGNRRLHVAEEGCDNVDKEMELSGTHATSAAHESEILKIFKIGAQHVNENEIEREAQEKVVEHEEAYQNENSEYARVNGKYVPCDEENECKLEGTSSDSEQSESAKLNGAQGVCGRVENDLKGEVIQDGNEVKLNSLVENTEEPEAQLEHQQNEKKQNADQVPSVVENIVEPGTLGGDHADGEKRKLKECNGVGLEETHNEVDAAQEVFLKASKKNIGDVQQGSRAENEDLGCAAQEVCQKSQSSSRDPPETLWTVVTENSNSDLCKRERLESEKIMEREREYEKEQVRKLEEEKEREREREKDRLAFERATCEARERALTEARERAERIAVERVTAEARQRALTEAREKAERASAEALEKSLAEKALKEARLRAERAAVERATAEARERAVERALAEKAAADARQRAERLNPTRDKSRKDNEAGDYFRMPDKEDRETKLKTSSSSSQRYADSSGHGEVDSPLRCKARLERHQRTVERAAKALAEKNMRDVLAQREQAERNRLAESLDADVRRWSTGKEGNLRALLSTLQYILGPESGWQPIPLTDVITAVAVKKAYRRATLCVHPDKLQQRGASIQQKYICEKVFDLLKEAWNRFNSEER